MEHFLIATTMLVVGIFAVLTWDSTFPDRRDVLVLAPRRAPVDRVFAKAAATATALSLVVLLLHCATGLTWPFAFAAKGACPSVLCGRLQPIGSRWWLLRRSSIAAC